MDKKAIGIAIEYIEEHMKTNDILSKLSIKTREWTRWTVHGRNPQHAMRRKIKKLYEDLRFKNEVKSLVEYYGPNYPSPLLMRDYENDNIYSFWSTYGLWLSRDDIYDEVNRLGQPIPVELDEDHLAEHGLVFGYGGDVEEAFDRKLASGKYLETLL